MDKLAPAIPPPEIAALIQTCDGAAVLLRTARLAAPDSLATVCTRIHLLDDAFADITRQLAQAGYSKPAVRRALIAAGRQDLVALVDSLDELPN